MKGIISIDGGGTKSEILVVTSDGTIRYRSLTGASNPNDIGMEIAFNNLNNGLSNALVFSKENDIEIVSIFLGIAGIEFGDSMTVLKEKLVNVDIIHSYYNKEILGKQELDIYIPQYKIAIEYQGKQHFKPVDFGGYGEEMAQILFSKNCKRDKRKKEICDKHQIKLFYFSDTSDNEFLGEKVYHNYDEFIEIINQVIKKENEK